MFIAAAAFASGMNAQDANSPLATMDVTLHRAIEIALAENPTIKVAEKEIEIKKVADQEAWQNLLPDVSVNLSLQHTLLAAEMKLNGMTFKMGRDGVNTAAGVATLNLPLFAPAVYQAMKLTKEDVKLAQEKSRSSKLDLVNQAVLAQLVFNQAERERRAVERHVDFGQQKRQTADVVAVGMGGDHQLDFGNTQLLQVFHGHVAGGIVTAVDHGVHTVALQQHAVSLTHVDEVDGEFLGIGVQNAGRFRFLGDGGFCSLGGGDGSFRGGNSGFCARVGGAACQQKQQEQQGNDSLHSKILSGSIGLGGRSQP